MRWIALVVAVSASGPAFASDRLDLVCFGGGAANKFRQGTVNAWDSNGNSAHGNVMTQDSVGFNDQVALWVEGSEGRVRMPRTMLPPIRGGEDGWFKLKDIEITDGEIRASVAVNVMNNPKLRLDRYTGTISISGKAGDFSGHCEKFDPTQVKKKF